jgi:hypothetical protein
LDKKANFNATGCGLRTCKNDALDTKSKTASSLQTRSFAGIHFPIVELRALGKNADHPHPVRRNFRLAIKEKTNKLKPCAVECSNINLNKSRRFSLTDRRYFPEAFDS